MPSFFSKLGPGLLLAATSIGASHLVLAPQAGQKFGFQLLWLVTLTHVFKYHAFEFGPRYAAATGESLIAGYMRLPGPKGWALWIFLFGTVAQGIAVLAGVANIAGSVLSTFLGGLQLEHYTAIVIATVVIFLFLGGYGWLDLLNKIMMVVLFIATVIVFVPARPGVERFVHFVQPSVPAGSILLIAGLLGWMPTGIDVSVWHSLWTLQKHPEIATESAPDTAPGRLKALRLALADMRIGYVLSFVVASVFLILAATFLSGTDSKIAGADFSKYLAQIYSDTIGAWMYPVFMIAAFFAMYSTTYTVMDGFSRSFAETVSTLFPELPARWWMNLYRVFVLFISIVAVGVVIALGDEPVSLVGIVAIVSLSFAPFYYGLNYYCVTRFIKNEQFKPGRIARLTALAGAALMFAVTIIYIACKLGLLAKPAAAAT